LENKAVEVAVDPGEYTLMGSYIVWVPRLKEYGSLEARLAVGTYYRVVKSGEVVQLIQTPCRSKIEAYDSILEIVKNGFLSTHYVEGSTTERFGNWSSGLAYGLVGPVRSCNLLLGLAKVHRYGPHGRQH